VRGTRYADKDCCCSSSEGNKLPARNTYGHQSDDRASARGYVYVVLGRGTYLDSSRHHVPLGNMPTCRST
jgi:hypothetical protein